MPDTNIHRTFFRQSGVVTEARLFLHSSPPHVYILCTNPFKLSLSLLALLVRAQRHHTNWRGGAIQVNAGMQPSSNRKRAVIFRKRLGSKQNEAVDVVCHWHLSPCFLLHLLSFLAGVDSSPIVRLQIPISAQAPLFLPCAK